MTKPKKIELTQEELKRVLDYNPETGIFTWLVSVGKSKIGQTAGCLKIHGYWHIGFRGKSYRAHRLAWLYVYGDVECGDLDHIDRNRCNNSISNLRECSDNENMRNIRRAKNNTSGFKGVHWSKRKGKWLAISRLNGKRKYLGSFHSPEDASLAYQEFCKEHHGEFYRDTVTGKLKQNDLHSPIDTPNPAREKQGA